MSRDKGRGYDLNPVIAAHIATTGWAVLGVGASQAIPQFAYTIGLTGHGLPELMICGLDIGTMHELLNDAARLVLDGARWQHGQTLDDALADGYVFAVVEGRPQRTGLWPGGAYRYFGRAKVRVQQLVWPDVEGRFPWDAGYSLPPVIQPTLGQPPST